MDIHKFTADMFNIPFMVKRWQQNNYYPLYRYEIIDGIINEFWSIGRNEDGSIKWSALNSCPKSIDQFEWYLYILNENYHILTTKTDSNNFN